MKFKNICFVMTDKCNAECDFCGFSCSPKNNKFMDEKTMTRLIKEAKQMGIKTVGFSGGEPFLYPDLLIKGVTVAREEKMIVSIATNGFWGKWDDEQIKAVLTEAKSDTMGFSYDWFHRKYIPQNDFFRAVAAAQQLGIKCSIHVGDMNGEYSAGRFIQSLGNDRFGKDYHLYPIYRSGRAEKMPAELFIIGNAKDNNLGCLYDNTISVLYNGDVYPCCRHQVFGSAMKLGNVKGKTLKEVIDNSDVPMICDVLMKNERFQELIKIAEDKGIPLPEYPGCSCDYCKMLFYNEENKKTMLPFIKEMHGEMLVRTILKEAQKDVN